VDKITNNHLPQNKSYYQAFLNQISMKKIIVSAFMSIPFFVQAQSISFTLKGEVKSWTERDTVTLFYRVDGAEKEEFAVAKNGKFSFSGKLHEPVTATLRHRNLKAKSRPDALIFYLEEGKIEIKAIDSVRYATINAGPVNKAYKEYNAIVNPLIEKMAAVQMKALRSKPEERVLPEFKALDDSFMEMGKSIQQARAAFIKAHPASFVSLEILKIIAGTSIDYSAINPLFEQLTPAVKKTPTGKEFARRLAVAKTTNIGAVLPNFTSLDTTGKSLSLNEVVSAGKVTLVDFWASWCVPCRKENPNVVKAYTAFHDKGFNIISVSLDEKEANWKYAIKKDGMPWYHASNLKGWEDPVAKMFDINGLPDSFLLDAQGRVIGRGLRGEALYNAVAAQLEKN
jgi:thiol-disulfide isomerase/thioredoxin